MTKKKVGVVIMRAQGYHTEHHKHIQRAAADGNSAVVVLFGSANKRVSQKNPFSVNQRYAMMLANLKVDQGLKYADVRTLGIEDNPDNFAWRDSIIGNVEAMFYNDLEVTLYGCDKDSSSFYVHMFPNWKQDLAELTAPDVHAKDIRELYLKGQQTVAYLRDYPYISFATLQTMAMFQFDPDLQDEYNYYKKEAERFSVYPYPETLNFTCGDAVVICHGKVLTIKRKFVPGKGCVALPGGFKNNDETFLDCILRELIEETGIRMTIQKLLDCFIGQWMFDQPGRSEGLTRVTMAGLFDVSWMFPSDECGINFPQITPQDDALETQWIDIQEFYTMENVYDDHADIVYDMITMLKG